jgi:Tol biopolymer transport system component
MPYGLLTHLLFGVLAVVGPSDTSPFVAPNGKTLIFYSTRLGGQGKADIYFSYMKHGAWIPSLNLGPAVNSAESDYNPSVSPDGKQFFFGGNNRIYVLPTTAIPGLSSSSFR